MGLPFQRTYKQHFHAATSAEQEYEDGTFNDGLLGRGFHQHRPSSYEIVQLKRIREEYKDAFSVELNEDTVLIHNINHTTHPLYDAGFDTSLEDPKSSSRHRVSHRSLAQHNKYNNQLFGAHAYGPLTTSIQLIEQYMLNRWEFKGPTGHGFVYEDDTKSLFGLCIIKLYLHLASLLKTNDSLEEALDFLNSIDSFLNRIIVGKIFKYSSAQMTATSETSNFDDQVSARNTVHLHETLHELKNQNQSIRDVIRERLTNRKVKDFIGRMQSVSDVLTLQTLQHVQGAWFIPQTKGEASPILRGNLFSKSLRENDAQCAFRTEYMNTLFDFERHLYVGNGENFYNQESSRTILKNYFMAHHPKNLKSYIQENDYELIATQCDKLLYLHALIRKSEAVLLEIGALTEEVGDLGISCLFSRLLPMLNAIVALLQEYKSVVLGLKETCVSVLSRDSRILKFKGTAIVNKLFVELPSCLEVHGGEIDRYIDVINGLQNYTAECTPENVNDRLQKAMDKLLRLYNDSLPNTAVSIYQSLGGHQDKIDALSQNALPDASGHFPFILGPHMSEEEDVETKESAEPSETLLVPVPEEKRWYPSKEESALICHALKKEFGILFIPGMDLFKLDVSLKASNGNEWEAAMKQCMVNSPAFSANADFLRRFEVFHMYLVNFERLYQSGLQVTENNENANEGIDNLIDSFMNEIHFPLIQHGKVVYMSSLDGSAPQIQKTRDAAISTSVMFFHAFFTKISEMHSDRDMVQGNHDLWREMQTTGIQSIGHIHLCMKIAKRMMTEYIQEADFEKLKNLLELASAMQTAVNPIYEKLSTLLSERQEALVAKEAKRREAALAIEKNEAQESRRDKKRRGSFAENESKEEAHESVSSQGMFGKRGNGLKNSSGSEEDPQKPKKRQRRCFSLGRSR